MRFANVLIASMLISAAFGTALARHADQTASTPARAELLSPAFTWLWQPPLRRTASAH